MIMGAQPYSGVLVRGSRRPMLNMMRRRSGLGDSTCMSGRDFSAAIGPPANCDPRDSACVMCNTQMGNAVSNLVDSGCVAPGTPITFACDTSPGAVTAFMANNPIAVNATVGTGSSAFVASGPNVTVAPPAFNSAPSFGGAAGTVNGQPPGYMTAQQQQQANAVAQQTTLSHTIPPYQPMFPQPAVVNPSPTTQLTGTGSAYLSPLSLVSQANGMALTTTGQSVAALPSGNWFDDPTQDLITGLPNWALLIMGAGGLFVIVSLAGKR